AAPNDWLGNAVPPGSACVAALAARSRPRSRLGRDHSNRRSKPGRDSPRKETASPTARHGVRTRKRQVDGRHDCQDNAPACVPSTVWGTASRRNSQVGLGAVLALENEQALSRHPPRVSPSQPQRARPPANGTHSSTKSSRKPPLRQPRSVGRCPSLKASSPSKRGFSPPPTIADSGAFSDALVAFERLTELGLALTESHPDPDDWQHAPALRDWRSLDLKGVHFRYGGEKSSDAFNIGPMDITLRRGEVVFIAGGNGSGKTTFAKVLTGLYTPTSGTIQFDGIDVDQHNIHWYRKKFAAVFADFCLFEGVADLQPDDLRSEVNWLTSRLELSRAMLMAPASQNVSTPFTSGERGRIALLRAVIEDRPVFVFDEWAADQDHEYKDFFYTLIT